MGDNDESDLRDSWSMFFNGMGMKEETDQVQNSRLSISLEKHFDKVIGDLEKRIDQRFDLMQIAVDKAEKAADERAEKSNQWREQYNQQEEVLLRKDEFKAEHRILQVEIKTIDNKIASVSKLVYIGLGIWLILQMAIGAILTLIIK
jgi:hypothetical protein